MKRPIFTNIGLQYWNIESMPCDMCSTNQITEYIRVEYAIILQYYSVSQIKTIDHKQKSKTLKTIGGMKNQRMTK